MAVNPKGYSERELYLEYKHELSALSKDKSELVRIERFVKCVLPSLVERDGKFWCCFAQNSDHNLDVTMYSCPFRKSITTRQKDVFSSH